MTAANRPRPPRTALASRPSAAWTLGAGLLLVVAHPSEELRGQTWPVRPEVSAGGVIGWLRGVVGRVSLPTPLADAILLTPKVELSPRLSSGGCDTSLNNPECTDRPGAETIMSVGVALGAQASGNIRPFPYVEAGGWLVHRFSSGLGATQRRDFIAPAIEAGFRSPAPWGRWSVAVRWRWIDHSRAADGSSELALLLGVIPGKPQ